MMLSEDLWNSISGFFPEPKKAVDGGGRPGLSRQRIFEGILWVLNSGSRWKDLPSEYPSYQTCHRLFQEWQKLGIFEEIFHLISSEKGKNAEIFTDTAFIDGTFVPAKKGVLSLAEAIKAKAALSWSSAIALASLSDLVFTQQIPMKPNASRTF